MADDTTVTTPPVDTTTVSTTEPEVKYEDIANKSVDEVIKDVEQAAAESPNPVEQKAEEVKELEKAAEVEFDPEKFKQDIVNEMRNVIVDNMSGKSAEDKKEAVDKWSEFAKTTWEKENRNPTYTEALQFVKEQTKEELKAEQQQEAKAQEDQQKEAATKQEETSKFINELIDDELNELYTTGKLPRITDPNDQADPGVVARKALFQTMLEVNQKRQAEGKPTIYSVHRIYNTYYKPPQVPAGADAPVAGGNRATAPESSEVKYSEIHGKPISSFLDGLFTK